MDYIDRLSSDQKKDNLLRSIVKIAIKVLAGLIICYLVVSAVYIWQNIDFGEPVPGVELLGQGYADSENRWRLFMGLPEITTSYRGVPPVYLVSVAARLIAAVGLLIWIIVDIVRWVKNRKDVNRWKY